MTELEFEQLAKQGYNRIPVVAEIRADLDTPVALYLKLANKPYTYLLESVVGGERFGRYSYIGLPSSERIEARGRNVTVHRREADGEERVERFADTDPFVFVRDYLAKYKAAPLPGLPRFAGGLVGYFGYETVRFIEKRLAGADKPDPLGTPDVLLMRSEELAVVDNVQGKLYFVVYADPALREAEFPYVTNYSEASRDLAVATAENAAKVQPIADRLDDPRFDRGTVMREEVAAGNMLDEMLADPARLEAFLRDRVVGTWHGSCSARMGRAADPLAVCDPAGRVHGVPGVRVADNSLMPTIPCANTHLPALMIGEKIADAILADHR